MKSRSGQAGFVAIVGIFLVVLVSVAAGGVFVMARSGKLTLPTLSMPTFQMPNLPFLSRGLSEKDFAGITDETVRKHFVKQANTHALRRVTKLDDVTTVTVEQTGDGEDMSIHAWESVGGQIGAEIIVIGMDTYVKDVKDVSWWKQTLTESPIALLPINMQPFTAAESINKQGLTFVKQEDQTCQESECFVYKETNPANELVSRTFWIDSKTLTLLREEIAFGELVSSVSYSYDDIIIQAPMPTKDVAEGEDIFAYLTIPLTDAFLRFEEGINVSRTSVGLFEKQFEDRLQSQFEERLQKQLEDRLRAQIEKQVFTQQAPATEATTTPLPQNTTP